MLICLNFGADRDQSLGIAWQLCICWEYGMLICIRNEKLTPHMLSKLNSQKPISMKGSIKAFFIQ